MSVLIGGYFGACNTVLCPNSPFFLPFFWGGFASFSFLFPPPPFLPGPRAREVLQALTDTDMSNDAFPFRMCKDISVGYARVRCGRITYLGELGCVG